MVADDYIGTSGPDPAVEACAGRQRTELIFQDALDGPIEEHEGILIRPGIDAYGCSIGDRKSQPLHGFECSRGAVLGSRSAIRTCGNTTAAGTQGHG
jgi:hypothetical protein